MRKLLLGSALLLLASAPLLSQASDPVIQMLNQINVQLAATGANYGVEGIDFFTIGQGRPPIRIHQLPTRWVPNDSRRLAQGIDITYLVDQSDGATASGLSSAQTEAAIDSAMDTWDAVMRCARNLDIVKRADSGADPDLFDGFFGGAFGNPFLADITHAGWLPKAFFDAVSPGSGDSVLAFTVTFIFVDGGTGFPTDINNDQYLDTAFKEIYYNDNFGDPAGSQPGFPWGIDVNLPGIDVETAALHESGHALELGHFGPPPRGVMNDGYAGLLQSLRSIDLAGHCAVFGSWPWP